MERSKFAKARPDFTDVASLVTESGLREGSSYNRKRYWAGTHRVTDPGTTIANLIPKLPAIGVTRIADVTGLDYIGIPVVMSTRPRSRSLSVHQGKGLKLDDAKASAIMESVEYHCAEQPRPDTIMQSSAALRSCDFILPRQLMQRRLGPNTEIPWAHGIDLLRRRSVFVPEELLTTDFSQPRPRGHGWFVANSNGLAAGNTMPEAVLHAICELIERDAFSLWLQAPAQHQNNTHVDPSTVGDPSVEELLARYFESGLIVNVWETTSDLEVPSFFCLIDDRNGRPPFIGRSGGNGCHPSAAVALCRALSEAAQSRLTLIVGARDDIEPEHYAMIGFHHNLGSLLAAHANRAAPRRSAVSAVSFDTASIAEDLDAVLSRLASCKIDSAVFVDMTRPGLDIPCARVVIPALEGMYHKPGYKPGKRAKRALQAWS
jgi:ribosomal protein S12 methylthiotransferase accessory factor